MKATYRKRWRWSVNPKERWNMRKLIIEESTFLKRRAGNWTFAGRVFSLFVHIGIVTPDSSILPKIRCNQGVSCLSSSKLSFPSEGLALYPTIPITSSISCIIFPNRVVASRKTLPVKNAASRLSSCRTPTDTFTLVTITVGFISAELSLLLSRMLDGLLNRSKPPSLVRHELMWVYHFRLPINIPIPPPLDSWLSTQLPSMNVTATSYSVSIFITPSIIFCRIRASRCVSVTVQPRNSFQCLTKASPRRRTSSRGM